MLATEIDVHQHRQADYPVDPRFVERWSPRAMSGESLPEEELMRLFEAARWAPSSYNGQPWRFIWARRDTQHWGRFLDLLVEFNRGWAKHAAALVVICSRDTFEHNDEPTRTHGFDTGAAWMNLSLQGAAMGLVVHGMEGFDYERAASELGVPEGHTVEAMCAVGRPGPIEDLPEDARERERPSDRKPVEEIAAEGRFPASG